LKILIFRLQASLKANEERNNVTTPGESLSTKTTANRSLTPPRRLLTPPRRSQTPPRRSPTPLRRPNPPPDMSRDRRYYKSKIFPL